MLFILFRRFYILFTVYYLIKVVERDETELVRFGSV